MPRKKGYNSEFIELLKDYKSIHGDTLVPVYHPTQKDYRRLSRFVHKARATFNNGTKNEDGSYSLKSVGTLYKETIDSLNELGFVWKVHEEWEDQYEKAKSYYINHGHSNVPQSFDPSLYHWCYKQRRSTALTIKQIELLEQIEFDFSISTHSKKAVKTPFSKSIEQLRKFKEANGHFNVPPSDKRLYGWLNELKRRFYNDTLSSAVIKSFNQIGYDFLMFDIQPKTTNWDDAYENLRRLKQQDDFEGSLKKDKKASAIKRWIKAQTKLFREGELNAEQSEKLINLGLFVKADFQARNSAYKENRKSKKGNSTQEKASDPIWNQNIYRLKTFKAKYGNCDVPIDFDDKELAKFVRATRTKFKQGKLTQRQIEQLQQLQFNWYADKKLANHLTWLKEYEKISTFFKKNGHSLLRKGQTDKKNYTWILMQRVKFKKGSISNEQIELLNKINFPWTVDGVPIKGRADDKNWNKMFESLREFKNRFGHARVSQTDITHKTLGRWLNTQRIIYTRGKLLDRRKELLESLGVEWNTKQADWDARFDELKDFKNKHGHFNVSQFDKNYKGLYNWIRHIRTRSELTEEQIQRLKGIDFSFELKSIRVDNFEERLLQLKEYEKTNGTFKVMKKYSQLYNWLKDIKKRPRLTNDQIRKMRQIGFIDDIPSKEE